MKVLTSASEICESIKNLKPTRIAVGYIGLGWKKYVSVRHLEEIVVSPRLGSNPKAIIELMDKIGEKKVYLLEKLHSKIYLGASTAMLGSCNLSDNGFSDRGLLESAVEFDDEKMRSALADKFDAYKKQAQKEFPTHQAKLNRLEVLKDEYKRAKKAGLLGTTQGLSIKDFELGDKRIHIVWYEGGDSRTNDDNVRKHLKLGDSFDIEETFGDSLPFRESDDVKQGDWLLWWRCNRNGLPRKRGGIGWLRVDHIASGGFIDQDYTKFVGEFADGFGDVIPTPEPFQLDRPTKQAMVKLLSSEAYARLREGEEGTWELPPVGALTRQFFEDLKAAV